MKLLLDPGKLATAQCYFTLQCSTHCVHSRLTLRMPRSKTAVNDLGTICKHGTEFRAHIHFRDDAGGQHNTYGPRRGSQNEAQRI